MTRRRPPRTGKPTPGPADRILTPGEVARCFRVDPATVTRWADTGKLPSFRTLGGQRRFYASEINKASPPDDNGTGNHAGNGPASDAEPPKYQQAAALVRAQIADGMLAPGESAPNGVELARMTGYSVLTCRRALHMLIKEGALVPGPSASARPRVPAPGRQGLADARHALSDALRTRRRAAGLTQPQLAVLTGVSTTAIGHAETGRLWHARTFWEYADKELSADGEILRLHDAYRAALAPPSPESQQQAPPDRQAAPMKQTETTQAPPPPELLTPDEHEAVRQAGLLYTMIAGRIIADGPTRDDDLAEIRGAFHLIQRAILAQAAARAYPREFRKLGTTIARQDDATRSDELDDTQPTG